MNHVSGIHHVTAIAGDPQRNLDFYAGVLGLRLVKRTVNFDDPFTYHFYFGDRHGNPGTLLTFFPWAQNGHAGRAGSGQLAVVALSVPTGSLGWWRERLAARGVALSAVRQRFGASTASLSDHDGFVIELVETSEDAMSEPAADGVPAEYAIRRIHSVTIAHRETGPTEEFLVGTMGLRPAKKEDGRVRFDAGDGASWIDVLHTPGVAPGKMGRGVVHHLAFRTADDDSQAAVRQDLLESAVRVTPAADRKYFRSIYFHEPGGVLFEVATDPPGFTADEPLERLGTTLALPAWMEPQRRLIESELPFVAPTHH